jgi:hypothetical protein
MRGIAPRTGTHREEGDRRWAARYGRPGMLRDPTSLLWRAGRWGGAVN